MNRPPIEIITKTSVYAVLKEANEQYGYAAIIDDIIEFCAGQPDLTFENKLIAAVQKFKEANE